MTRSSFVRGVPCVRFLSYHMEMKKQLFRVLVLAAAFSAPAMNASAQTQPNPNDLTQLRPPSPGKQDSEGPVAMSMLTALAIVGLVVTANLIASNRSHQD